MPKKDAKHMQRAREPIKGAVFRFNCENCAHAIFSRATGRCQCLAGMVENAETVFYEDYCKNILDCKMFKLT